MINTLKHLFLPITSFYGILFCVVVLYFSGLAYVHSLGLVSFYFLNFTFYYGIIDGSFVAIIT
jgi:hypothetical protein